MPNIRKVLRGTTALWILVMQSSRAHSADVDPDALAHVQNLLGRAPPLSLFPLTQNDTSIVIPDIDQTFALIFATPNLTGTLSPQAIELLNQRTSHGAQSQALYDLDEYLEYGSAERRSQIPRPLYNTWTDMILKTTMSPSLSLQWTTISGSSFWIWPSIFISLFRCSCESHPAALSVASSALTTVYVSSSSEFVSHAKQGSIPVSGEGCSPKALAHGRVPKRPVVAGKSAIPTLPPIQTIVQAQFDMIVNLLRNTTAIPILESIKLRNQDMFNYTVHGDSNELATRMMKVAGLPDSAADNMRGFLTMRQYALYQLLRRGDSDCPISPTTCGKFGTDRCDRYPRSQ